MRMRPHPFVVPKSGDPFANDTLGRKDQIEALTVMLRNIEGPCVLALDAPWGAGKTAFLQMWAQYLRRERFRVADFNAWETDFSDDPLIALYAALEGMLERSSTAKAKNALKAGATMVSKLASTALPVPDVVALIAAAGDRPEESTEVRLKRHRDAEEAIGDFKKSLEKTTRGRLPLVVFIDELDRCRPDYAVSLLESTKHIFDVEGVIFVLAVNLTELAHSVSAMYGRDFKGELYLRRFVDHHLYLPKADQTRFLESLMESVGLKDTACVAGMTRELLEMYVFQAPHLSLRDIEKGIHHLSLVIKSTTYDRFPRGVPLEIIATTLVVLRMVVPHMHRPFIRGEISDLDVLKAINQLCNRTEDWWIGIEHSSSARFSAKFEAVLTGWHRFASVAWDRESPLLLQRRAEAEDTDNVYASFMVSEAETVRSTDKWMFERAQMLVDMMTSRA